jgi:hypothetical protein
MIMKDTIVIAEKISHLSRGELTPLLEARLRRLSSGLDVSVQLQGFTGNGFVRAQVKGSDSEVFTELIKRKLGLAPSDLPDMEVNDNFKAYVTKIISEQRGIQIDLGPVSANFKSEITREALAAQLCDGMKVPVDKVARAYCLQEDVPLFARVTSIDTDRRRVEAWISDDQVSRFEQWRHERVHRIIAVGGFQDKLREALRFSKVDRDIIEVEELALTAHSLVCKLGTDAPGIIAKIGRYISNFKLYAFIPERVDQLRAGAA